MATTSATLKLTEPDVNDKVEDTIAALAANFAILDALFPIGYIYQSTKSTDPGTFIGGTWTALTGRVLVGAGTDFPAGSTGGTATVDAHSAAFGYLPQGASAASGSTFGVHDHGMGATNSNMPPFKSVYMWERTA